MYADDGHHQLEDRFTEPEGWRWHSFERAGRRMRFGSVFPKNDVPDAIVVCLPGLSEYADKYFELARDFNNKNLAFWVLDWMGQGASDRYLPNHSKRHSTGFDDDVADLHYFVTEYIKHSSVHPEKGRLPLVMLGHSMGSNIGLQFLAQHPGFFECAAFSAPLMGIPQLNKYPQQLILALSGLLQSFFARAYAFGQGDWRPNMRPTPGYDQFSSDKKRGLIQCYWWDNNPDLRLGGVTFGWLHSALKACKNLEKLLPKIQIPVLIGIADDDTIVDNQATEKLVKLLPDKTLIHLKGSKHEILMESDAIRDSFLNGFYDLIDTVIINKPEDTDKR